MEEPGDIMEEIYALPPRLKYTENWLELKEKKGFTEYWAVLKGTYIFFFKDLNTHAKEQHVGYIGIEVQATKCNVKKNSKREFTLEMSKKKFQLRVRKFEAGDEIVRSRWIHAINLVNRADAPGPLPGDPDFKEICDVTPAPHKMKKRGNTIAAIPIPVSPLPAFSRECAAGSRDDLSLDLKRPSLQWKEEEKEEAKEELYDPVFVFPSWYYPNMSSQETEQIMADQQHGSYLLRDSSKSKSMYTLCIKDIERMRLHRIVLKSFNGKCYFESSPTVMLPNLVQAVEHLMKNTYRSLDAQPVCIDDRQCGDGAENVRYTESPGDIAKSVQEKPCSHRNGHPSFAEGDDLAPESPSDPILPGPGRQFSSPDFDQQRPYQKMKSRKANSLPGYSMSSRPLPNLPDYENHSIIECHYGAEGGEYLRMHSTSVDNNDVFNDDKRAGTAPPVPTKKYSLQSNTSSYHEYENVPFIYSIKEFSYVESP